MVLTRCDHIHDRREVAWLPYIAGYSYCEQREHLHDRTYTFVCLGPFCSITKTQPTNVMTLKKDHSGSQQHIDTCPGLLS